MASGDPSALLKMMEGRWSGVEMNFAFEGYWSLLLEKFPNNMVLKMIMEEGRNSQIYTEHAEIRVLSQNQVMRAQSGLSVMQLKNLTPGDEDDEMLEDLFSAMQNFFTLASDAGEFVLVSYI